MVTITFETSPKLGGNQIPGGGLGIYAIKIESTAVEMFWIAKKMLLQANMEEKCHGKTKFFQRLENQQMEREFPIGIWDFMA